MKQRILCFTILMASFIDFMTAVPVFAETLKAGDAAPPLVLETSEGKTFDLKQRKGQWTVLYFYPKAETPGCTKQACAFRDNIKKIRELNADVFGISADTVKDLQSFKKNHNLNFTLLADPEQKAIDAYGTRRGKAPISKRWTFIISPELKIASIDKNVDPVMDAQRVAQKIKSLTK